MNIHEYQAKQLLAQYGVTVPQGEPCKTVDEARAVAERIFGAGHEQAVVKSQIHAGGRGKGVFKHGYQGGVKLGRSVAEVAEIAGNMLGKVLVTKQTGAEGRVVQTILVAAAETIQREFYLAILLDRSRSWPLIMASTEGGVEIEEVAEKSPEKILKEWVDPGVGLTAEQAARLARGLGLTGDLAERAERLLGAAYKTWWECDAAMVEINPLCIVKRPDGSEDLVAVDAKISLDDNALFRHPEIVAMRDLAEESPLEVEASKFSLNYIKLDGSIACLVNGAGLAMATMDIVKHYGGSPANFLDVGGGASREQVAAAFKIILSDPNVKAIFVNIFGGIMDCNVIATGIVAAVRETGLQLPLIVRLEGNNVAAGRATLQESGLTIVSGDSMADAAQKAVKSIRK